MLQRAGSSAVVSLLTYWMACWPPAPKSWASNPVRTYEATALFPLRPRLRLDGGFHRLHADDRFDQKLLARRAAIEFLHFFRATVDARESQSRDRAGSR